MDHRQVLPALGTALGDGAVAEEEIVEVDQHRGIVEDDGQGHPIEGVAGDFSEQGTPPFLCQSAIRRLIYYAVLP